MNTRLLDFKLFANSEYGQLRETKNVKRVAADEHKSKSKSLETQRNGRGGGDKGSETPESMRDEDGGE
jgi:hypothetical protein